jgi:imidazolonepropionase-like amidohydrolase
MCGPYVQMEPVAPWAQPSIVVRDPSAVPEVIDELLGYDVDAVKLYVSVNAQVTETLVAKAHEAGLPVTAHLGAVRATEAAGFGIDGIEHAAQGLYADLVSPRLRLEADDRFKLGLSNFWARFMAGWAEVDPESQRSVDAIAAVTRAGTSLTPTLSVLAQTLAVAGSGPPTGHGRTSLEIWTDDLRRLSGDWTTDQIAQAHEGFQRILAAVLCFSKVGGRIVVGTDLPPGESYAEELALLSRAGLSPAAVIRAATQDAADVIGLGSDTGSIDAGKTADLVLVKGNPLNDMGSFANVIVAIKRGQIVLSRSDQ